MFDAELGAPSRGEQYLRWRQRDQLRGRYCDRRNTGTEWSSVDDGQPGLPHGRTINGRCGHCLRALDAHDGHDTSAQIGCFAVENQAGQIFGPFAISDANQLCGFPVTARGQRFTFGVVEASGGNTGEVEIGMFTRRTP